MTWTFAEKWRKRRKRSRRKTGFQPSSGRFIFRFRSRSEHIMYNYENYFWAFLQHVSAAFTLVGHLSLIYPTSETLSLLTKCAVKTKFSMLSPALPEPANENFFNHFENYTIYAFNVFTFNFFSSAEKFSQSRFATSRSSLWFVC